MNELRCDTVLEAVPDWVSGRLAGDEAAAVASHVAACEDCRAEAELAALLFEARPEAPPELAARIERAVRHRRIAPTRPWWGLSAAAVAVLALGIGVQSQRGVPADVVVPGFASADAADAMWVSDDGLIAGAPALDGLSEEDLLTLLEEMDGGGAA